MTTRNLNKPWRDVVFDQYAAGFDANVPFSVRYPINAEVWKKNMFYRKSNQNFSRDLAPLRLDLRPGIAP